MTRQARWILGLLGGCCCAYALDPARAISRYHKRHWQVEDGLPRNHVLSILPARDGYLMVGTDEGRTRFDGVRFTPYDIDARLKLSQRWILSLLTARDRSLWVGTFDGLLYRSRAGKEISRYEPGGSVFAVMEDQDGRIWASTRNGVVRYASDGRAEPLKELAKPPETGWNVLSKDRGGVVWVVTIDGLCRCAGRAISRVAGNGGAHGQILAVTASPDGNVGGDVGGAVHVAGSTADSAGWSARPSGEHPARSRRQPLGGHVGQWHILGGCRRVHSGAGRDGLSDDLIRTLYEDSEGNLWIGTRGGGLNRWKDMAIVPVGVPEELSGNYATTVATGPRGELRLGTCGPGSTV